MTTCLIKAKTLEKEEESRKYYADYINNAVLGELVKLHSWAKDILSEELIEVDHMEVGAL